MHAARDLAFQSQRAVRVVHPPAAPQAVHSCSSGSRRTGTEREAAPAHGEQNRHPKQAIPALHPRLCRQKLNSGKRLAGRRGGRGRGSTVAQRAGDTPSPGSRVNRTCPEKRKLSGAFGLRTEEEIRLRASSTPPGAANGRLGAFVSRVRKTRSELGKRSRARRLGA